MSEGERAGEAPDRLGPHPLDLLPAYALDALEAAESSIVAAHVERCPQCAAEVRRLRGVVDRLPLATTPEEPPPRVRARLLDNVRRSGLNRDRGSPPQER